MLTLTLEQLRREVGLCLDIPIDDAYLPNVDLDRWINMAVQECAALRAQYGLERQCSAAVYGSANPSADSDGFPQNERLQLPDDVAAVVALNLNYQGVKRPLQPMAESDRVRLWSAEIYGPPEFYTLVDATPSQGVKARVWPPMQSDYQFELIYRPQVPTLVAASDAWEYLPGTEDLVVCRVALKEATREGIQEPAQYQAIQTRYERALLSLQRMSARDSGVRSMRDTRSRPRFWRGGPWL